MCLIYILTRKYSILFRDTINPHSITIVIVRYLSIFSLFIHDFSRVFIRTLTFCRDLTEGFFAR